MYLHVLTPAVIECPTYDGTGGCRIVERTNETPQEAGKQASPPGPSIPKLVLPTDTNVYMDSRRERGAGADLDLQWSMHIH